MIGWVLKFLVMAIGRSLRWRLDDPTGMLTHTPQRPVIFAAWHNRLFLIPYLFWKHWTSRYGSQLVVMVSASKDGAKLAGVLEKCGFVCVRGSSSRRGQVALLEMTRLVQAGYDAGITPDGPRGPKYKVATGIIQLAQLTGAPIIPISYDLSWKIALNSWDGFMIPLPFGRATLRIGAPVMVAREAGDDEQEHKRLELETVLKSLSEV